MTQWTQLGPREREILTVLRCAEGPLTTLRETLDVGDGEIIEVSNDDTDGS